MIERLVAASEKHRGYVMTLTALLACAAAVVGPKLRLDALPDVTTNQVQILTRAPGFSPEEVEQLVTRPVEISLGGIPGLSSQRSISRYGIAQVTAVFEDDVDPLVARQWVNSRIQALAADLPDGVAPPEMGPLTGGLGEIYHFALSSRTRSPSELLELAELRVAPLLRQVPGVVEVNTWGGKQRTLDVTVDPVRLSRHGQTLSDVRDALASSVSNVAGASVPNGSSGQALLRGTSRPYEPSRIGGILIKDTDDGTPIRVADVATVTQGGMPRLGAATRNGQGEIVYVMVQMLRGDNALLTVERLRERMPLVRKAVPDDVSVDMIYDRSELVNKTLDTLGKNLSEGALLVILVLLSMLGSVRAGLIVALTIPLSMLGALVGMVLFDIPGNLMSLGAIDFGLIVDGGVVMMEGIFHRFHEHPPEEGERRALIRRVTSEMARPVFVSVGIIVIVYAPVLTLSGVDGKLFRPMALTVVMALLTSLVLSLFFVPAMASRFLHPRHVPQREPLLVRGARVLYEPTLRAAMAHPRIVTALAVASLVTGGVLFMNAGSEFVPQLDEGDLVLQTTQEPDIRIEAAVERSLVLESTLMRFPEVTQVVSRIGSPAVATDLMGLEQADIFVALKPKDDFRPGYDKPRLIEEMRVALEKRLPSTELAFTQPIQMRFNELLGGSTSDVTLSIYGPELDELQRLAGEAAAAIEKVPGAADVRIAAPPNVPLVSVTPDPLSAAAHGLGASDVLQSVQALRSGVPAATTYEDALQIPILVHTQRPAQVPAIGSALVSTPSGRVVELDQVARVQVGETPSVIARENAERRIVIGFNVRGADLQSVVTAAQKGIEEAVSLPAGYRPEWGGQQANLEEAQARLAIVIPAVLISVVAILGWLFRHLVPAGLIFLNVPISGVGGIVALTLRGMPVSISATVGLIVLAGIAVLNGVVLMSHTEGLRTTGTPGPEAAMQAAHARMRPVLMTALVAALGFLPMMFATGVGAEVQRPLATVVVGGLITSTLLTLLVLPSLYAALWGRRD